MKKVMVTKEQKIEFKNFMAELVLNGRVKITNDLQHKFAMLAIETNMAIISKKKNYGRIAEIKYMEAK